MTNFIIRNKLLVFCNIFCVKRRLCEGKLRPVAAPGKTRVSLMDSPGSFRNAERKPFSESIAVGYIYFSSPYGSESAPKFCRA